MSNYPEDNRLRVRSSSRDVTSPPAHTRHQEPVRTDDEMYELRR